MEGSFIRLETMCVSDVESRLQRWNRNIVLTVKRSLQEEMHCTADREGLFMCTKAKFASRYTDSNIQIGESTHAFLQRRLQNIIVTGANGLVLKRLYLFQCMDERSGGGIQPGRNYCKGTGAHLGITDGECCGKTRSKYEASEAFK